MFLLLKPFSTLRCLAAGCLGQAEHDCGAGSNRAARLRREQSKQLRHDSGHRERAARSGQHHVPSAAARRGPLSGQWPSHSYSNETAPSVCRVLVRLSVQLTKKLWAVRSFKEKRLGLDIWVVVHLWLHLCSCVLPESRAVILFCFSDTGGLQPDERTAPRLYARQRPAAPRLHRPRCVFKAVHFASSCNKLIDIDCLVTKSATREAVHRATASATSLGCLLWWS